MRLIDADVLLEKVREIRKLALDRAVETPDYITYPIFRNPTYTRYSTQVDEREKFKVMIEEEPTVQLGTNLAEVGTNLVSKQAEQRWIPCSDRMPEEHEWIGTKSFGTTISDEVYVTFEAPDGQRFADHISFQNGRLSRSDEQRMKVLYKGAKPIAWMPLPEPYKAERGEACDK